MDNDNVKATLYKKVEIGADGISYNSFTKILDEDGDIISYPDDNGSICFEPLRPFIGQNIKLISTQEAGLDEEDDEVKEEIYKLKNIGVTIDEESGEEIATIFIDFIKTC